MEKYKKLFIYLIIICIQILVVLGMGLWEIFLNGKTITYALNEFNVYIAGVFLLCFLFSFVPVSIAGKNLSSTHFWVWIIPFVFLIPVPFLFYHSDTCVGNFCDLGDAALIIIFLLIELVYIFYYLVAKYLRKWDISVSVIILKVFLVLYSLTSLVILYQ